MGRMTALLILLSLVFTAQVLAVNRRLGTDILPRKQLAGPPADFDFKKLPRPSEGAQDAQSALFEIQLTAAPADDEQVVFSQPLTVDSTLAFAFSVFSPYGSAIQLSLTDPTGNVVNMTHYATESAFPIGSSGNSIPSTTFFFTAPQTGTWTLTGSLPSTALRRTPAGSSSSSDMAVLLWNQADMRMYSQLNTYQMLVGQSVGLNACIYNRTAQSASWSTRSGRPRPVQDVVQFAELNVQFPSGAQQDFAMRDDGLSGDELAGDGVFGAVFTAPHEGIYVAQAFIRGKDPQTGIDYVRTSQHLLKVMGDTVQLQPHCSGTVSSSDPATLKLSLDMKYLETNTSEELVAYAEVWGTNSTTGALTVPVAWVGGAVDIADTAGSPHIDLHLDLRWLSLANATSPLELRNVYVQNQLIPVSQLSSGVPVTMSAATRLQIVSRMPPRPSSIVREMREGPRPDVLLQRAKAAAALGAVPTLLLVHGYCAQYHPFQQPLPSFTDAVLFTDYDQSRTNDEFAQRIAAFAALEGFPSFGCVSHSQGGLASLHLHAYYWTNLELAQGPRLLQSVGSPYLGSALAGSSASLGKIFGVGCGANYDLTHDGAALWLRGINSTSALSDVYYYTTQYQTGSLLNYCSLPTNLLLSWPNDGMAEYDYSPLAGGTHAGHTMGECHTLSMQWSPQCWDEARDAEMSTNAAR